MGGCKKSRLPPYGSVCVFNWTVILFTQVTLIKSPPTHTHTWHVTKTGGQQLLMEVNTPSEWRCNEHKAVKQWSQWSVCFMRSQWKTGACTWSFWLTVCRIDVSQRRQGHRFDSCRPACFLVSAFHQEQKHSEETDLDYEDKLTQRTGVEPRSEAGETEHMRTGAHKDRKQEKGQEVTNEESGFKIKQEMRQLEAWRKVTRMVTQDNE